jgi:hypothetical protein
MGKKPEDIHCLPLSCDEHSRQGRLGESIFWGAAFEAAKRLCLDLYAVTGDDEAGRKLVQEFRKKFFRSE